MLRKILYTILAKPVNRLAFFSFLAVLLFFVSRNHLLFWDNVLFVSRMGNEIYNNGLFNWHIPQAFDPGHPPIIGFLSAFLWKIFGHKLWVTHLLMIPFTIGFFCQLFRFINFYVKDASISFWAFVLIIADPTLSAQLVLVNPEILHFFFFFLAVNGILYRKISLKITGLFFLSLVSFRGMMLAGGIFVFEVLHILFYNKKAFKQLVDFRFIGSYLSGAAGAISFLAWHYHSTGWIHTRPDSPFAKIWFVASFDTILRNIVVLAQRYADFGRVFIYIFILLSLFFVGKKILTQEIKQLFLLAFSAVSVVIITSIFSNNPMGHRYFLASYIVLIFIAFLFLKTFYTRTRKKLMYLLLIVALITGNLWIYPPEIAQGWDASLAHLPYHSLRQEALQYMHDHEIDVRHTASFFPNITRVDYVDLGNDTRWFENYNGHNDYIFYSNVYNIPDSVFDTIHKDYTAIKTFKSFGVYVTIYKKKN